MEFKRDRFKQIRKQQRWSLSELARKSGISRMSLSKWENGRCVPSEKMVRELSQFLNVSVSEISDLIGEAHMLRGGLSEVAKECSYFSEPDDVQHRHRMSQLFRGISDLDQTMRSTSIVVNALLSSMHSIFYVKDVDQKYIIANKKFLKNLSLGTDYSILGKRDSDLFNKKEAEMLLEEDRKVLFTGNSVIDREGFIPGTRKKRWGLISKIPIFDRKQNIIGVAGVCIDITERKKSEKQRAALNNAVNKLEECVWVAKIIDLEKNKYKVVYANDAIEKMAGIKKEEFYEKPELWTEFIAPEYQDEIAELRKSRVFPRRYQYKAIRQDTGETYWRDDMTYKDGDMFFGIARDVSLAKEEVQKEINENNKNIAEALIKEGVKPEIIEKVIGVTDLFV